MDSFIAKYNFVQTGNNLASFQPLNITRDQLDADIARAEEVKGTPEDFLYKYGRPGIVASNAPEKNNHVYSASEVQNNTVAGLSATSLSKVEISLGISASSDTIEQTINKQLVNTIGNTLNDFGIDASLYPPIKAYTQGDSLETANALINKGASAIVQSGGSAKDLDEFLYSVSKAIDSLVADVKSAFPEDVQTQQDEMFGTAMLPKLRVWQSNDVHVNVVSQVFSVVNADGDTVEISASFDRSQSLKTQDYSATNKLLDVKVTSGSLSEQEREDFNTFLDDFSQVTNAIFEGDELKATEALGQLTASDYGFQSIEKVRDNTYQTYNNTDELHIYDSTGHNGSRNVLGTYNGKYVDESYVQGGRFHGTERKATDNLADFDMKYANTHQQATSGMFTPVKQQTTYSLGALAFSAGNADKGDGVVLQDKEGTLYRYEHNADNRDESGWRIIPPESVNIDTLSKDASFSNYLLGVSERTGQVQVKHLDGGWVTTDTQLSTSPQSTKEYQSTEISHGDIYETRYGELYEYVQASDVSGSGWQAVEDNETNREKLNQRQEAEDLHKYLFVYRDTHEVFLAHMVNDVEKIEKNDDIYLNMRIQGTDNGTQASSHSVDGATPPSSAYQQSNNTSPRPVSGGDIYESDTGQLYEYVKTDQLSSSGWQQVEDNDLNRDKLNQRQQLEVLHRYLNVDKDTRDVSLISMSNNNETTAEINGGEHVKMKLVGETGDASSPNIS